MTDRKLVLEKAKRLGLPARGGTELLARKINILKTDPKHWTEDEFRLIMHHLSIHQDFREGAIQRVEAIMRQGLNCGMVDSLGNMVTGRYWTFGKGLIGNPAYVFVTGGLQYLGRSSPYLKSGNKPLFAILPTKKGQDIYEAIIHTSILRKTIE